METTSENSDLQNNVDRRNQNIAVADSTCAQCGRNFRNNRGVLQHLRYCTGAAQRTNEVGQPPPDPQPPPPLPQRNTQQQDVPVQQFLWGPVPGDEAIRELKNCYEEIVFWRKNLFMLPKGASGKEYIRELTRLVNEWVNDSPIKSCSLYAIHCMPALLLQKPSKTSKSKDHVEALTRRMTQWKNGEFNQLLREGKALQNRLPKTDRKKNINALSRKFREHMSKGNVNSAIKLLSNNMSGGVLPLNDETIALLRTKHPEAREMHEDVILQGPIPTVENVIFDVIDEHMVYEAAKITRGGSGPSGMDADGWRRILTSRDYGDTGSDLRKAIASMIKTICTKEINDLSLAPLMASRLVPLDKNPGLRPIGVGEVIRRIMGKVVMSTFSEDVVAASSEAQMCGRKSGSEAAIHAMRKMFAHENTDAVILVDAANAFNNLNRKAMLHNIKFICPEISKYVTNCYSDPARLFVIGGLELKSQEGTTQGDPLGMAIYALGITPMMNILLMAIGNKHNKMVGFADDITAAGDIAALREWWDHLLEIGPCYGYFPQPTKSWLIVKNEKHAEAIDTFEGTEIQISIDGERHLGAVIGSADKKTAYITEKINKWRDEIILLAEIASTNPQAAYTAYVKSYQHKMTYFLRTIPNIKDEMKHLDEIVRHRLIPALVGGHVINDFERSLLSLPPRLGGLGLKILEEEADTSFQDSMDVTKNLQNQILGNQQEEDPKTRYQIRKDREERDQAKLQRLIEASNDENKRMIETLNQKGVSNWLTVLPLKDQGYQLSKQEFWDAIQVRYNWPLDRLPTHCPCGANFNVAHTLSCKKGGFITLRHNEVRDITAGLLSEVCPDVRKEPLLVALGNEELPRNANKNRDARLDISALNFWTNGQRAFFDVRVFNLFAQRHIDSKVENCLRSNECEKKKKYGARVRQAENGTFTPLVFAANGAMGAECVRFYKRLSELIADKRNIAQSLIANKIRTVISFSLLRSTVRCIRGSRNRHFNVLDIGIF